MIQLRLNFNLHKFLTRLRAARRNKKIILVLIDKHRLDVNRNTVFTVAMCKLCSASECDVASNSFRHLSSAWERSIYIIQRHHKYHLKLPPYSEPWWQSVVFKEVIKYTYKSNLISHTNWHWASFLLPQFTQEHFGGLFINLTLANLPCKWEQ